ncbi:MAG: sugar transferase [Alphaproteobacteria bacterium]
MDKLNSFPRRIGQKALGLALFGIPFVILTPIVTLANAIHGVAPFYKQKRYGRDGQAFEVYKFKSMHDGDEPDAARVTLAGKFLRKSSLDEIPQLINILKGEMDVVGWRPVTFSYADVVQTSETLKNVAHKHHCAIIVSEPDFTRLKKTIDEIQSVNPGITGVTQISEFRGQIEGLDPQNFQKLVDAESEYIQQRKTGVLSAIWQDLKICAKTPFALVARPGVVARPQLQQQPPQQQPPQQSAQPEQD